MFALTVSLAAGSALAASVPFSFELGGTSSLVLLGRMTRVSTQERLDPNRVQNTTTWWDSTTGFWVESTSVSIDGLGSSVAAATDWVLTFGSNGSAPTPPLCMVAPLNVTLADASGVNGTSQIYRYRGSFASVDDYSGVNITLANPSHPNPPAPILNSTRVWGDVTHHDTTTLTPEACRDQCIAAGLACGGMAWSNLTDPSLNGCWLVASVTQLTEQAGFWSWVGGNATSSATWAPSGGRSSNGELPLFTAVTGGQGITLSIGWSGNWVASASRLFDGSTQLSVAHPTLCAPLLPGDSLRSMRVVLVAFNASTAAAYHSGVNAHRRMMTTYKMPRKPGGGPLQGALVASWSWIGWPSPTLENQLVHVAYVKNSSSVEAYWVRRGCDGIDRFIQHALTDIRAA